jgi:hypothetical protein
MLLLVRTQQGFENIAINKRKKKKVFRLSDTYPFSPFPSPVHYGFLVLYLVVFV